jgi:hypothetical protein
MHAPQTSGMYSMNVNNLMIEMIEGERVWDTNKIQSLFNAETAKAIPAVPIFHE